MSGGIGGVRVKEAADRLEALIQAGRPGDRLPPMRTLLRDLGVSLVTLNGAVASLERRGLLSRKRGSGLYIREAAGPLACLIISPLMLLRYGTSPFYPLLITALQEEAEAAGLRLQLHFSQWVTEQEAEEAVEPLQVFEQGFLKSLMSGVYQGALTVGLHQGHAQVLKKASVRSASYAGVGDWEVSHPLESTVAPGIEWLATQGSRKVACWGWGEDAETIFLEHAKKWRIQAEFINIFDSGSVDEDESRWAGEPQASLGFRLACERLSHPPLPDSLLLLDDAFTQGVLMAMSKAGLSTVTDVRVATLAVEGSPTLLGWEPHVHGVIVRPRGIASAMVESLLFQMGFRESLPEAPPGLAIRPGVIH